MVDFKGLIQGMSTVQAFAGAMLGVYAIVIIATLFLGILVGVGEAISSFGSADNGSFNTTLGNIATSYNGLVTTLFDPVSLMIQLIIVVVLLVIFFKGGLPGSNASKKDIM